MTLLYTSFFKMKKSAGGGGGPTSPLDGKSPTAAWSASRDLLSAFAGNPRYTLASGVVDSLKDQSGNARNLGQNIAGFRPPIAAAGPNNRDALDFDGANMSLFSAVAANNFVSSATGYAISSFIVDVFSSNFSFPFTNPPIWEDGGGNVGLISTITTGPSNTLWAYNFDGTSDVAGLAGLSAATPYVAEWKHEGGNIMLRVNMGAWQSVASGNAGALSSTFNIGKISGSSGCNCKIFELATWITPPSGMDQDAIAADFMAYIGA